MKKSELWDKAIICVLNGDLEDEDKVRLIEMMLAERSLDRYREQKAAEKAGAV